MKKKNFTLVELLVVIAIIGVLAALLFPAVQGALKKAEIAKCKSSITTLVNAIKQYEATYGKLPCPKNYAKSSGKEPAFSKKQYNWLIMILQGEEVKDDTEIYDNMRKKEGDSANGEDFGTSAQFNKRKIKFLDIQGNYPGEYLDPWDYQYKVILDCDYNGNIEPTSSALYGVNLDGQDKIYYSVIVWSVGDDGDSSATLTNKKNKDNVYSFPTIWNKDGGHVISK